MTILGSSLPESLLCKLHIPLLLHRNPEGLSSVCIFSSLEVVSYFRMLGSDKLMTAAFLKSRNLFTGSFFRICPMENTLGQEPGRQMCSLQTAPLSHKLHEQEDWQLIATNEAIITINFKQIPFGPHFSVWKPICYLPVHLHLFTLFTSEQADCKCSEQSAVTQTLLQTEKECAGRSPWSLHMVS